MNNNQQITTSNTGSVGALREDLQKLEQQFRFALPPHIPVARFTRVVMTAVQNNPKLLKCTRQSFFNACMKAAQDGLLPDGREGAIVPYGEEEDGRKGADIAQWMPMIIGIRKKVRNAGLLRDWNVQVVQQGDEFEYQLGDDPFIRHKPASKGGRARPVLFAYSIATYPDGTKSREVMNIDQIKDIQSKSKARRGPWSDPIFFPEMARKTVARLHSKQLPMSTDLDTLLRRDDALYDFQGERERARADVKPPPSVAAALDTFAADDEETDSSVGPETDSSVGPHPPPDPTEGQPGSSEQASASAGSAPAAAAGDADALAAAFAQGRAAKAGGQTRRALPGELRAPERAAEAAEWQRGFDQPEAAEKSGTSKTLI